MQAAVAVLQRTLPCRAKVVDWRADSLILLLDRAMAKTILLLGRHIAKVFSSKQSAGRRNRFAERLVAKAAI